MSEWIDGVFSTGSTGNGGSSVVIVVSGNTSPKRLEMLKMELKKWAKRGGLTVNSFKVIKKKAKKKKKK